MRKSLLTLFLSSAILLTCESSLLASRVSMKEEEQSASLVLRITLGKLEEKSDAQQPSSTGLVTTSQT